VSSVYRHHVGDVVELRARAYVRNSEWERGTIERLSTNGMAWIVRLLDGSERVMFEGELRPAHRCCVCPVAATFTAIPSCKPYCDAHRAEAA